MFDKAVAQPTKNMLFDKGSTDAPSEQLQTEEDQQLPKPQTSPPAQSNRSHMSGQKLSLNGKRQTIVDIKTIHGKPLIVRMKGT